jgi:hypothetical protein
MPGAGGACGSLRLGGVSMVCHRSGRSAAGGAVMPWPSMPSLAMRPIVVVRANGCYRCSWIVTSMTRRRVFS